MDSKERRFITALKNKMKNIGFVSLNSGGTMGHMSLLTNLANKILKKTEHKCFIFSEYDYAKSSSLKNNNLEFVKIKKQEHSKTIAGCFKYKYKQEFLDIIKTKKIDILIFSTFFDKKLVEEARKIVQKVFLISYPLRDTHREAFFVKNLYELFDKVFTLKDIVDLLRIYPNETLALPPNLDFKFNNKYKRSNKILITCGGGGRPSSEIFFNIIKENIKDILERYPELEFTIIKGNSNFNFNSDRVKIIEWSNNFIELVKESDFIISESGYFTIMELLALNKPALVIPGARRIDNQELRAVRFEGLGKGFFMLPEQDNNDFFIIFDKIKNFKVSETNVIRKLSEVKLESLIFKELI